MIILLVFAFLAGVVTILSPCILPVLPIILSSSVGGKESGKARPIGVVAGFIISFTFFTLFLSTLVRISGISADGLRIFSVIVVAGFGISMLIPKLQQKVELAFSKISRFAPQGNTRSGFGSGVLVGLSLGLLWTPCVGPILASVISLALAESVTANALLITFAYSIGTSLPMFLIMIGGQKLLGGIPWLRTNTEKIQRAFGVLMILTSIAIFTGVDRKIQSYLLDIFPQYGSSLTKFEDIEPVRRELENLDATAPQVEQNETQATQKTTSGIISAEIFVDSGRGNSSPFRLGGLQILEKRGFL